jgi:formylglycine-generating enzyme required for sulfatase activity
MTTSHDVVKCRDRWLTRVGPRPAAWRPAASLLRLSLALAALLTTPVSIRAEQSDWNGPVVIEIPAGPFIAGSDPEEREAAYALDQTAYGHDRTRRGRWYASEYERHVVLLEAYWITRTPITNADYARFVAATGHPAPDVDSVTWSDYGLAHPYERTRRHAWLGGAPPVGREQHPVVLVSHADAEAYAAWLTSVTGERWRLPTEWQWEPIPLGRHLHARIPE